MITPATVLSVEMSLSQKKSFKLTGPEGGEGMTESATVI